MRQQFFVCPRCRSPLERSTPERLTCPRDGLEFRNEDGIWRFLLPETQAHYAHFSEEYQAIRRYEQRGAASANYYRALPYKDLSGRYRSDWRIRARSFDALVKNVLTRLQNSLERSLKILDLGAGNGWLSNRLAAQGDRVVAVDLLVNEQDGLGAWKYYETSFIPVQAQFDNLPVMDDFADAVIFNASLHYSEDYARTLQEALRVLSNQGVVVIMDSPVYTDSASGTKMVEERKQEFLARYGFASDALESENYLTYDRLRDLGTELKLTWKFITPFYGLQWMIRPWVAFFVRRREPAKFHLIVGKKR
jgi:SAM-dependent methyltransferase